MAEQASKESVISKGPCDKDIRYESHSYYVRIGLELILLLSVVFAAYLRFDGISETNYRGEELGQLRLVIEEGILKKSSDVQKNELIKKIDILVGSSTDITIKNIPQEYQFIDEIYYRLICREDFEKLANCWVDIENSDVGKSLLKSMRHFLILVLVVGYIRVFIGTHFIDYDITFQRAIINSKLDNLRFEAPLRLLLYASTILAFGAVIIGNNLVHCFLFVQCVLIIVYLFIFNKVLNEDEESKQNLLIYFTDVSYIVIIFCFIFIEYFVSFMKLLGWEPLTIILFLCPAFLAFALLEFVLTYWDSIWQEIKHWYLYVFDKEMTTRKFGPWQVKSVKPKEETNERSFTHIVEFKNDND